MVEKHRVPWVATNRPGAAQGQVPDNWLQTGPPPGQRPEVKLCHQELLPASHQQERFQTGVRPQALLWHTPRRSGKTYGAVSAESFPRACVSLDKGSPC